jgi:acyl carrier protein
MPTGFDENDWAHRHVILFLAERSRRPPESISTSERLSVFFEDSLDLVELIMGLEDEFSIELDDHEAAKLDTVQDLIEFVRQYGRGR